MNNHRELLWSKGTPDTRGNDPQNDIPTLTFYTPSEGLQTETAVIICPGGGYATLSVDHEGHDIAKWLNTMGITAVILEYRMSRGGYRHLIPLQDAQRAIRTVRARSGELKVNPAHIGIMGFSAGGHLASTTGTHFDPGNPESSDPIERVSSRPDFMVLCYPVIGFGEDLTHSGSRQNLLGENPSEELIHFLSNEKQVTADTPPTFLFHTDEDEVVLPEHSVAFYLALRKAKVPAELHIYQKGPHGVGLAPRISGTKSWPDACRSWLSTQGFIH